MIGIRFKIPNDYNNFLYKILEKVDNYKYTWLIKEEEVLTKDFNDLFSEELYKNEELKQLIINEHYIVFVNIQLINGTNVEEITNYKDFLSSNCILILFVTDSEFVDIYSKSEKYLKTIETNAKNNRFKDIKIIYEDDSIRNEFSAYAD